MYACEYFIRALIFLLNFSSLAGSARTIYVNVFDLSRTREIRNESSDLKQPYRT